MPRMARFHRMVPAQLDFTLIPFLGFPSGKKLWVVPGTWYLVLVLISIEVWSRHCFTTQRQSATQEILQKPAIHNGYHIQRHKTSIPTTTSSVPVCVKLKMNSQQFHAPSPDLNVTLTYTGYFLQV